jgi:WD40-like Beta Propeller Repeat
MKRVLKITLFSILTILLSSSIISKNIRSEININSLEAIREDTTSLIRFINVDSFRLDIIPPSSGVQFYKDGIVFLSMSKNESKMSPDQISFGAVEAYYASVGDSVLGRHMIFSPSSSFSYPCEAMTFNSDYNTVYFTRLSKKDRKEKIFMAKFATDSKNQTNLFPEITPLNFCADDYTYSHPALSSDEKMLVFASDMKGSFGGMDLFVSRLADGKWSVPENLGNYINTPGNEFFPFLDSENNLFFSSDGLPGYGGYDIFTCKFNGTGWDKPVNLTDRINSDKDDIAFTINKMDGKIAFFTRRQKSARIVAQLFRVTLKQDAADRDLLTLSYIFNGKPVQSTGYIAEASKMEVKSTVTELPAAKPGTEVIKTEKSKIQDTTTNIKKFKVAEKTAKPNDVKVPEKATEIRGEKIPEKTNNPKKAEGITSETSKAPDNSPVQNKIVTIKPSEAASDEQKEVVVYRVQLIPDANQKKSKEMEINGTIYKIYEYQYRGENRWTIGEFGTLAPATTLQNACRRSGYPQSFVVAFKNNIRSLDVNLFK